MTSMGRVVGHGMGILFIAMGVGFLVLGLSDAFTNWLDTNSSCYGNCDSATSGARTTFVLMGVTFTGVGVVTSFLTEFSIRKTRHFMGKVSTFTANPQSGFADIEDLLEPLGININPATNPNASVNHRVIDLRSQRRGEVPTDPGGLNDYLKGFGINLGEEALRNATVVDSRAGQTEGASAASAPLASGAAFAAAPVSNDTSATRRESATIVRKRDRGATSGNQRLLEFELEVKPVGKVPYRVQIASLVRESLAGLLIEGSTLNVRVDAHDDNAVTIDWSEN